MTGRFDHQPDMAVNACALIPPALHSFSGNRHLQFHGIFSGGERGYIVNFSGVAGVVLPGELPIDIQRTFTENAVEFQKNSLFRKKLRNFQIFAVFPGTAGQI